jgi:phosphopantetheinyl transferase (holo-ACP synthase)
MTRKDKQRVSRHNHRSPEPQTGKITFRLPGPLYQNLKAEAKAMGVSEAWVIKEALYKALGPRGWPT